jgi:hypothetical protein
MKRLFVFSVFTASCLMLFLAGCGGNPEEGEDAQPATDAQPAADSSAGDGGHPAHGEGPHGGVVTDWGGGAYHVEFTVDHDKKEATVYILGSDEKTPAPIKADKLLLSINEPEFQAELKAQPLEGEAEGMSSRFVGTNDNLGIVREFAGTISGEVDGTPYAGDFKEEPHGEH